MIVHCRVLFSLALAYLPYGQIECKPAITVFCMGLLLVLRAKANGEGSNMLRISTVGNSVCSTMTSLPLRGQFKKVLEVQHKTEAQRAGKGKEKENKNNQFTFHRIPRCIYLHATLIMAFGLQSLHESRHETPILSIPSQNLHLIALNSTL